MLQSWGRASNPFLAEEYARWPIHLDCNAVTGRLKTIQNHMQDCPTYRESARFLLDGIDSGKLPVYVCF
jgi:hypothetical protein